MIIEDVFKIGPALLKSIGLPDKKCRGFELRCYVDEIVTVKAEYYAESIDTAEIEKLTKTFEWIKK